MPRLVVHAVQVAVAKDRVVAAAGAFPGRVVLQRHLPRHGMVQPQFGAAGEGFDEGVIDEQFASRTDVDGVFGEGEAADGEEGEDEEGARGAWGVSRGKVRLLGMRGQRVGLKLEIRSTKSETNSKYEGQKSQTRAQACRIPLVVSDIAISSFEFVSYFVLRISDFTFRASDFVFHS